MNFSSIKMNKKFVWLILMPFILSTVFSCKNLLEIEETDFIGGATALRTVANNESLLMGAYQSLGTDANFCYEMNIRLNGVLADELKPGEFYAGISSMHEWQYAADNISIRDSYMANTTFYRVIDRVNRILEALPNAIAETEGDEAKRERIRGEALFLRAFAHFELFRHYCNNYDPNGLGMIYMETPSLEAQARINMGEYFQKLLRDLTDSKPLLVNSLSDIFRVNRLTAAALQARIALYTHQWNDAITYSTEFIDAVPLASRSQFEGIWEDENNDELSWKLARTTSNRIGNFYRAVFTRDASTGNLVPPQTSWLPSDKLWNSYDQDKDIRFSAYLIDEPIMAAVPGKPSRIVHKYAGSGYATTDENVADIKVFRTSEMYLIRAEARAETGSFTGANSAESDVNTLRAARIDGYTNVTFASQADAIEQIIQERFKELAFEGHRFWDLKRRGLPVERLSSDAPSSAATTLEAGHFRFVMPIPQSEILANSLIQQNPGY